MQQEMLAIMAAACTPSALAQVRDPVYRIYCNAVRNLPDAAPSLLANQSQDQPYNLCPPVY